MIASKRFNSAFYLWNTLFVLLLLCSGFAFSDERQKVAIVEFQNRTSQMIRWNGWTLADELGKQLKKTDQFETVKSKEVRNVLKKLSWNEDRLDPEQETKMIELGARYVIYGRVHQWRNDQIVRTAHSGSTPNAILVFAIDVADLQTGKIIQSFEVEGNSSGVIGRDENDPFDFDERKFEELFTEATVFAMRKAAGIIAKSHGNQ